MESKMIKNFFIIFLGFFSKTFAIDSYDSTTNTLNIPSVVFGSTIYNDVNITVGKVLSVGTSSAINQTYDLNNLYLNMIQVSKPESLNFNLSGVVNSIAYTGSGSATINPMLSGSFEGISSKSQLSTSVSTANVDGFAIETTTSDTFYFDQKNNVLGFTDSLYHVASSSKPLPSKVSNYSSGIWFVTNDYADSSKKVLLGKTIVSYDVFPSNDYLPFINLTYTTRDKSNNVTNILIRSFLITNQGLKAITRNLITNGTNPANTLVIFN